MLDIKLLRTDVELVKENLRKKFQEHKIPLVDEIVELDRQSRETRTRADVLRNKRNSLSKEIGVLMAKGMKDEAELNKAKVAGMAQELADLEVLEEKLSAEVHAKMMIIPNIIDPSVPIGRDDSENVEVERFGEPSAPDFEIPYHVDIMEKFRGIDLESARKTSGSGFYFLCGWFGYNGKTWFLFALALMGLETLLAPQLVLAILPLPFFPLMYIMDLTDMNFSGNSIQFWHCGSAPRRFADSSGMSLNCHYKPGRNVPGADSTPVGTVNDLYFRSGQATVARFAWDYDHILLFSGEFFDSQGNKGFDGSRGWMKDVRLAGKPVNCPDLMNTILNARFPHHYAIISGNYENEVMEAMAWLGIAPVEAIGYKPYLQNFR